MTRDADFLAISEKDIFEEARDRLKIAQDADSKNRPAAKAAMRFREGDQWDQQPVTSVSQQEPELTINMTDALVRRVVNNIKQQRPRGKAHPVGDGANVETAEVINGIGRHVEARSRASVAYDMAADCAVVTGEGYFRLIAEFVAPDSFKKDLRILPIRNRFSVYMDPSAIMPSGSDADWCIISTKMKRMEYKRKYPRAENASWAMADAAHEDWEDREEIRLAEYFRIREMSDTLYRIKRQNGEEYTRFEDDLPSEESLAAVGDVIADSRESMRRQVEWFRLNGRKVIEREILPGQWIPVFRIQGNVADIDGEVVKRGMVAGLEDPQRMVNYGETAKIKRLGLAKKAQWVAAEGQLDGHPEWDNANQIPHMTLTYKPVVINTSQGDVLLPPPQQLPPAQIEAGFSEFVQSMRTNLMFVAGMPSEPGADTQGTVVSGRAIQKRQGYSDQSHFQYYDNTVLAVDQLWCVMLEWIPHYYSEKDMQRIIGEDGTPSMIPINTPMEEDPGIRTVKNDLSVGRYDVVMETGPGYETKREEGSQTLVELLSIPALAELIAKTGPDLVFRSIDHPYMQELADRLMAQNPEGLQKIMDSLSTRARALVQALSNENAQLKQALQQAQMEAKYGIAKAHLAATVKAHDVEESNKTKRIDTQTRAHTALAVEEIRAAGKILDTHAQAGHDERLQQQMIENGERAEKETA